MQLESRPLAPDVPRGDPAARGCTVVSRAVELDASPDEVWRRVQRPATLRFVARGLLGFGAIALPTDWREGNEVSMRLWLAHVLPAWRHTIRIVRIDPATRRIVTEEGGGLVRRWRHTVTVDAIAGGRTLYRDEIAIDAGVATPAVGLFARAFYAHRQRRWKKWLRVPLA